MAQRPNPFDGVTDLFTEFHRMREVGVHGREHVAEERQRTHASAWVPTTDIVAVDGRLVIRIELAGVDPADVDLRFANGVLTVSGTRDSELDVDDSVFYVRERFYGEFRRSISLPEGTRREQITAGFDDGLVEITVEDVGQQTEVTRIALNDRSDGATTRSID